MYSLRHHSQQKHTESLPRVVQTQPKQAVINEWLRCAVGYKDVVVSVGGVQELIIVRFHLHTLFSIRPTISILILVVEEDDEE